VADVLCLPDLPAQAADPALSSVVGNWLTEPRDGIIQVSVDAKGNLEGRIIGGNHPGLKDEKNPDPARRGLALRGPGDPQEYELRGGRTLVRWHDL